MAMTPLTNGVAGGATGQGLSSDRADFSLECSATSRRPLAPNCLLPRSLKWNVLCTVLAKFISGACQWGLLIILAKLGNAEVLGQFALGLAICAPVFLLTDLQLRVVQATDAKDDFQFGHYLGLRLLSTPLALFAAIGLAGVLGYRWDTCLVIGAIALAKMSESFADCIHGAMQKLERLDLVAVSTITRNLGSIAVFIGVFYLSRLVSLAVLGQALVSTLVFLAYDCPRGARLLGLQAGIWVPRLEWGRLSKLARLALPLGLVCMIISVNANLPRYLLERSLGESAVGIFAALYQPTLAGGMMMAALGQTFLPRMAKSYATNNLNYLTGLILRLAGLGALLGMVLMAVGLGWGREILVWFYRPEYAEHQDTFVWLMAAGAIGYVTTGLGYGLNATREYSRYLVFYFISVALGALLGILLIPKFGLKGAAWTVCTTNLLSGLLLGWLFLSLKQKGGLDASRN
jgi:O-antigen/teichoic acid export membrane protein